VIAIDDGVINELLKPIEDHGVDMFDDLEDTRPVTPIPDRDARLLEQLVSYARLRPACIPRVIASALKRYAIPVAKSDAAKVEIERIREHLLTMSTNMEKRG
jgi:hypothetical protein